MYIYVCVYKFTICSSSVIVQSQPILIPRTIACQAPLSMGFFRQEYWSGLPGSSPGDLLSPGIQFWSPALQEDSLPSEPPGKPWTQRELNNLSKIQQLYQNRSQYPCLHLSVVLPLHNCVVTELGTPTNAMSQVQILCTFAYAIPSVWQTSIDHFKLNFSVSPQNYGILWVTRL